MPSRVASFQSEIGLNAVPKCPHTILHHSCFVSGDFALVAWFSKATSSSGPGLKMTLAPSSQNVKLRQIGKTSV